MTSEERTLRRAIRQTVDRLQSQVQQCEGTGAVRVRERALRSCSHDDAFGIVQQSRCLGNEGSLRWRARGLSEERSMNR